MDEKFTLSVIIPAYNCESTLGDTIESVLNQKCKDYEIIIVNDGSTDNTDSICLDYKNKYNNIKYIKKDNSGVSDTRNVGIKNANGLYIAFLDSDDVWDKDYYDEGLCKKLKDNSTDLFVFSTCFADMDLNIEEYVRVKNDVIRGGDKAVDLYYHSFCAFIFRRAFLIDNNMKLNSEIIYGEDELFRSQCLYLAKEIIAEDKLSFYYRNNRFSSTKVNRDNKLFALQKLKVYYSLKEFFFKQYEKKGLQKTIRNGRTVSYFADSIKLLAETGYGFGKLKKICTEEQIDAMLKNVGELYNLYYIQKDILTQYIRSPKSFYIKNRVHGIWYYNALDLKHWILKVLRKR